jgi:hypothetical protein
VVCWSCGIEEEYLNPFRYNEYMPAFLHCKQKFACEILLALSCVSVPVLLTACTFRKTLYAILLNFVLHNFTHCNFGLSRMPITGTLHVELQTFLVAFRE